MQWKTKYPWKQGFTKQLSSVILFLFCKCSMKVLDFFIVQNCDKTSKILLCLKNSDRKWFHGWKLVFWRNFFLQQKFLFDKNLFLWIKLFFCTTNFFSVTESFSVTGTCFCDKNLSCKIKFKTKLHNSYVPKVYIIKWSQILVWVAKSPVSDLNKDLNNFYKTSNFEIFGYARPSTSGNQNQSLSPPYIKSFFTYLLKSGLRTAVGPAESDLWRMLSFLVCFPL